MDFLSVLSPAKWCFVSVMSAIAFIDWRTMRIPNVIVIPATALGLYFTGNFFWAAAMLAIGMAFFGFDWTCPQCGHEESHRGPFNLWRGGDVKLLTMIGAFFGIKALGVVAISYGILVFFRWKNGASIPGHAVAFSPYVALASLFFIFL